MRKILIFGNSGSGKSTLAKELVDVEKLAHLDLDTLAWLPGKPPVRAPLEDSKEKIFEFVGAHEGWVIEGCYTDLLEMVSSRANEMIFLNLDVAKCIENAKSRPFEPHKYESKEAQDENLEMLVKWIEQYPIRDDVFSYEAHQSLYDSFKGAKTVFQSNERKPI